MPRIVAKVSPQQIAAKIRGLKPTNLAVGFRRGEAGKKRAHKLVDQLFALEELQLFVDVQATGEVDTSCSGNITIVCPLCYEPYVTGYCYVLRRTLCPVPPDIRITKHDGLWAVETNPSIFKEHVIRRITIDFHELHLLEMHPNDPRVATITKGLPFMLQDVPLE